MKLLTYFIAAMFSYATMMCANSESASGDFGNDTVMAEPGYSQEAVEEYTADQARHENNQDPVVVVDERKLIKRGDFELPVKKLGEGEAWVRAKVKEFNGYIAGQSEQNYDYRNQLNMELRIPAASFDDFTTSMVGNFKKFNRKDINVKDVTEEYLDISARIKTKKVLEERYMNILKSAKNVKEILEVERQISIIREEIESAQGRLKYLSNQTSYSTINITMYTEQGGPQIGYSGKFGRALVNGWNGLLDVLVALVTLWPLFLIGGLFIWGLIRLSTRSSRKAAKNAKKQEIKNE